MGIRMVKTDRYVYGSDAKKNNKQKKTKFYWNA